jgi:hypothetical protein
MPLALLLLGGAWKLVESAPPVMRPETVAIQDWSAYQHVPWVVLTGCTIEPLIGLPGPDGRIYLGIRPRQSDQIMVFLPVSQAERKALMARRSDRSRFSIGDPGPLRNQTLEGTIRQLRPDRPEDARLSEELTKNFHSIKTPIAILEPGARPSWWEMNESRLTGLAMAGVCAVAGLTLLLAGFRALRPIKVDRVEA